MIISLFLITIDLFVYSKIANAPMRFNYTQQQKLSNTTTVALHRTNNEYIAATSRSGSWRVIPATDLYSSMAIHDLIIYQYYEAGGIHQMGCRTLSPGLNPIVHH